MQVPWFTKAGDCKLSKLTTWGEVCNFQVAKELFEGFYGPFKQNHEDYK
jgi:hypothetical protein